MEMTITEFEVLAAMLDSNGAKSVTLQPKVGSPATFIHSEELEALVMFRPCAEPKHRMVLFRKYGSDIQCSTRTTPEWHHLRARIDARDLR